MKKIFSAFALIWITSFCAFGQNSVGINTPTPNGKAVLELVSPNNNQGFLVPRLTSGQRNGMTSSLTGTERGLMVYDTDLNQFWHWDGTQWKAGLGVLGETAAGGDLEGIFPNPTIRDNAVGSAELTDVAGNVGTFGSSNDSTILEVTVDTDGRVTGVVEKSIRVGSGNILDASILNQDIATATITISKLDGEGNANKLLATDPGGIPYWEDRDAFASSQLVDGSILIGSASGLAEAQPVGGDLIVTNSGSEADFLIADNAINNAKVARTSLLADRMLGPRVSDGRGLMVAQQSTVDINIPGFGVTPFYVPSFVTTNNSSVIVTDANGNVSFEPRSSFELTTLAAGNVFIGTSGGTLQIPMDTDPTYGSILVGGRAGTNSIQARAMTGDVFLFEDGATQIQNNAVQGDDIDATNADLNISGTQIISFSTSSTSTQAIQLNSTLGSVDINGNQGVAIDATNNDINIAAASGDVNITGNNLTNILSNTDISLVANNDLDINTVLGVLSLTSADALNMTGGATSVFTTTFGDIDINAAFQLDLDGQSVAMDATNDITISG